MAALSVKYSWLCSSGGLTPFAPSAAVCSNAVVMPMGWSALAKANQLKMPMPAPTRYDDHDFMVNGFAISQPPLVCRRSPEAARPMR